MQVTSRHYEHCAFTLDCSSAGKNACKTTVTWPSGEVTQHNPDALASEPLGNAHGRAYYDRLH